MVSGCLGNAARDSVCLRVVGRRMNVLNPGALWFPPKDSALHCQKSGEGAWAPLMWGVTESWDRSAGEEEARGGVIPIHKP